MALLDKKKQVKANGFIEKCMVYMKSNMLIVGAAAIAVVAIGIAVYIMNPSAETVFKDMNEEMLKTKFVTVDQNLTIKSTDNSGYNAEMNAKLFLNMSSDKELLAKGNFSMNLKSASTPMNVMADITKVSDGTYVRFTELSSTDSTISEAFSPIETKLKDKWVVSRDGDQWTTFANAALESVSSVLPTPYANLNDSQRKAVLDILRDKSTYTIGETSRVDLSGTSTYKYSISYNKDQYKKVEKLITDDISYFKKGDSTSSTNDLKTMTVWINISTRQIVKIEYTGSSSQGDVTGTITFSDYGKEQTVTKPTTYSIESELLN